MVVVEAKRRWLFNYDSEVKVAAWLYVAYIIQGCRDFNRGREAVTNLVLYLDR
jgi:hypothetical protein